jgi:rod shape-determining protein MreC
MIARLDSSHNRALVLAASMFVVAMGLDVWQQAARRAGTTTWFDNAVSGVARPLQTALVVGADAIDREWMATVHARDLIDENTQLWDRVAALESALLQVQEARAASERVASLQDAYGGVGPGVQIARVIGVGQGGWSHYYTLNRGEADGVGLRAVAVTGEGVVGQVYAVTARSSRLMPITEPSSAVSVRLRRSRDTGVLEGVGEWRCEVRYLSPEADVKIGDEVITSGLGGVYPAGLRVGTVVSVIADEHIPGKIARVEPSVGIGKIENVLLLSAGSDRPATAPRR